MFNFSLDMLKWLCGLLFCVAIGLIAYSFRSIKEEVPDEDRDYLDPLPPSLRLIWPLVNVFTYYVGDRISVDSLEKHNTQLRKSGVLYMMRPAHYVGLRVTAAFLGFCFFSLMMLMLDFYDWRYAMLGLVFGYFMPAITLRDLRKKRENSIIKALPVYLDYLTMSVQAGMNMTGAIQQAVDKGPDGNLRVEFNKVLRDLKAGMPRLEAIREMADRNDMREINAFATAVIQAEKTGGSIGDTLRIQADQRRVERFQRAEKLAMEAPVKLTFPLVAFILPMTFLIVFFPIAIKFFFNV
jgi:tight adherence protein C